MHAPRFLLALKAMETRKTLVLKVPKGCRFEHSLRELIETTGRSITREDL